MVFVDLLTSQLFALGFAGLLVAYLFISTYLRLRRGRKVDESIRSAVIPIALLGAYLFVTGLFGQFTWPLPGSYNILFYDLLALTGLLLIAFAWAARRGDETHNVGFLALLLGLLTIYYGYEGYTLGLSQSPIALLSLYSLLGIAGVLAYPSTLVLDAIRNGAKKLDALHVAVVGLFVLAVIAGSLMAIVIAGMALPVHLVTPP